MIRRPIEIFGAVAASFALGFALVWAAVPGDSWSSNTAVLPANSMNIGAVAHDGALWIFGGVTSYGGAASQKVYNTTSVTGSEWSEIGTDQLPQPLSEYGSAVFTHPTSGSDVMVLTGGQSGGTAVDDLSYSDNGISWVTNSDTLPYAVAGHCSLVFDGKLWLIGGASSGGAFTGAFTGSYSTSDLSSWTLEGGLPDERTLHGCAVHDGRMWVIGGRDGGGSSVDDVYYSFDGATWTSAGTLTANSSSHVSVPYDGKIWRVGQSNGSGVADDVHSSVNGSTWLEVGNDALPANLRWAAGATFQGRIFVIGGQEWPAIAAADDVYYTDSVVGEVPLSDPAEDNKDIIGVSSTTDQSSDSAFADLPLGDFMAVAAGDSGFPIEWFYLLVAIVSTVAVGLATSRISPQNLAIPAIATLLIAGVWAVVGQGVIPWWMQFGIVIMSLGGTIAGREMVG